MFYRIAALIGSDCNHSRDGNGWFGKIALAVNGLPSFPCSGIQVGLQFKNKCNDAQAFPTLGVGCWIGK